MNNSIITQINSPELYDVVKPIVDSFGLMELRIHDFEEFFHALMHVKPTLFIVEINNEDNPYLKIIQIVKKSIMTRDIPIIVIATDNNIDLLNKISEEDIQDIIYPPLLKKVIRLSINNVLKIISCRDSMKITQDIQTVQSVMISGLASLAEYRDPETGEHIKRTQNYVKALATALRRKGEFLDELTIENIEAMYMSIPLHDIGKVGIRDEVLLKPGRLTAEEFEIMKTHTTIGYETIKSVGNKLKNSSFLEYASDVAYTHHEKFDGSGYPRGLQGTDIPLVGRLMAVADVYDALTSKRVYKEAMSHEEAVEIIKKGIGGHFDPIIVECMMELEETFRNISITYKDFENSTSDFVQLSDLFKENLLKKILVVEDSRIVREITQNQLKSIGFDVDVAVDGESGFKAVMENDYDLILLDIEMPKMNGYQMAAKVIENNQKAIMIAMTATDYNSTLSELKKIGITGLVLKPIDFNRLATIYSEALRSEDRLPFVKND